MAIVARAAATSAQAGPLAVKQAADAVAMVTAAPVSAASAQLGASTRMPPRLELVALWSTAAPLHATPLHLFTASSPVGARCLAVLGLVDASSTSGLAGGGAEAVISGLSNLLAGVAGGSSPPEHGDGEFGSGGFGSGGFGSGGFGSGEFGSGQGWDERGDGAIGSGEDPSAEQRAAQQRLYDTIAAAVSGTAIAMGAGMVALSPETAKDRILHHIHGFDAGIWLGFSTRRCLARRRRRWREVAFLSRWCPSLPVPPPATLLKFALPVPPPATLLKFALPARTPCS